MRLNTTVVDVMQNFLANQSCSIILEHFTGNAFQNRPAAEKYADAVESIPLALAENAGMSVIDTQAELRTKSKEGGKVRYGIDVFKGKVADLSTRDIYEPLTVKNQVINSATEAACMLLRIDNIISASAPKSEGPPPGSPYGGMPEY